MFKRRVDEDKCTLWIRASTRRLCVDDMILNDESTGRGFSYLYPINHWKPGRKDIDTMSYNGPNHEAVVMSSLPLSGYHKICGGYSAHSRSFSFPAHATATFGMVVKHHSNCEVKLPVNIVFLPLLDVRDPFCSWSRTYGWPGLGQPDVASIGRDLFFNCAELWLSQANHIFSSLQIRSNHNQYVAPPKRSFRWPDCAAYWSRDPLGAVRLSLEEAEEAGFPLITLELSASGDSWDSIDYAALWQFHQAKGFAPDSQEIARHLGHPLYELCDEVAVETPFTHVTDGGIEEDNTDQHDTNMSTMSDEHVYETLDSEHGNEDEKFEGLQADILLPSRGVRFLSKLPIAILTLVVLCCLPYTTY
ncbi:hypothetical protein B0H16DRAFT_1690405 [Mycena metata]|uniref:Uncharacterized protein n=1 Tax=Mycena metata TaxID=1033252 RepID=A0AAD7ND57_9AGAR|nr:hypothetical protein B0H16DRAFT_1690405 [Mycena metata]